MSNLSDKEIDRLSREAADFYEPDHSSLSWSRLEQKLTDQMPERPPDGFHFGRINPYVWGPALVLFAGISFFVFKNIIYRQHSTQTSQTVNQTTSPTSIDDNRANGNTIHLDSVSSSGAMVATESKNASSANQPNSSAGTGTNNKKDLTADQRASIDQNSVINPVSAGTSDKTKGAAPNQAAQVSKNTLISPNSVKKGSGSNAIIPASVAAAVSPAIHGTSAGHSGKISGNSNGSNTEQASADINSVLSPAGSNENADMPGVKTFNSLPLLASSGASAARVAGNDSLLKHAAQTKPPVPYKSLHVNRSLNFGFAFGPDYTDAGGITNDQLSNNIGITIGYYLTNKLSLNTGIFYTNKFYWSPGHGQPNLQASRYSSQSIVRTFAAPPQIEYVNGSCNMYELPVTLRYDFAKNDKTKFFVNAGLSSYFMLKQTYINFFHSSGRPVAYKLVDDQQLNYWFGVADFSFGLETEIGKGFSFQAEPFFRFPLKNMGLENLKLNSYGFLLTFRYAPVLSRTKK